MIPHCVDLSCKIDQQVKMNIPTINLLSSPDWLDYELLDSGLGFKLERYGKYILKRPEPEAIWSPSLPEQFWKDIHAEFVVSNEKNGGHWVKKKNIDPTWLMDYKDIRFMVQLTASRHLGVFPEQAAQWDWIQQQIQSTKRKIKLLNLFGYTGIASLAAAKAGAMVTHVDASRKVINWGQENQKLSLISESSIRWLVDDAFKFVKRESRRGSRYDAIIMDPPKFGRGPKGEVWEFYKILPDLLNNCREILSAQPLFVIITAYAVKASSLTLYNGLQAIMQPYKGKTEAGEVILPAKKSENALSMAVYSRWSAEPN